MKKLFAIISALMLTVTSYAQDDYVGKFTVQPMVGLSATSGFVFSYEGMGTVENQTGLGFTVGADFGYRATQLFYPTVGVHYVQSRLDLKMEDSNGNITANNLAIPVLANFDISGLRLGIGIQPTFALGKSTSGNISYVKDGIKSTTFAVPVVVGYELRNGLTFEYRAAFDITKSIDFDQTNASHTMAFIQKLSSNNLTSMITIGYKFKM